MVTVTACALQVKTALVELLKSPFRMLNTLHRRTSDIFADDSVNTNALRVPIFYAFPKLSGHRRKVTTLTSIVALLFGGIHCAGWNFHFPSHAELIIWRVSSLIILIVPCIGALMMAVGYINIYFKYLYSIVEAVFSFGIVIYVLARLTLFVEAFIALRHLPPGAYAVVEWTALLLHM